MSTLWQFCEIKVNTEYKKSMHQLLVFGNFACKIVMKLTNLKIQTSLSS